MRTNTETNAQLIARMRGLADMATPQPWDIWDGPTFVGGGADLCIGAGKDWVANMDHRYGPDYLERVKHENDSGHAEMEGWPPDCGICSFNEDATQEERDNAAFIVASRSAVPELCARLAALQQVKDGAYGERNALVAAFSKLFPSSLERHVGAEWEDDWRWVVFIDLPAGQASWHIHDSELPLFDHMTREVGRSWDGHTTAEKYMRLAALEANHEA